MLIEEQATNNIEQRIEGTSLALQHTPPYAERYQRNPWLADAEAGAPNLPVCSRCGFPANAVHQCSQEAA